MTLRMNGTSRRWLAGSALGGLIAFAAAPATAQWLPPWRAAPPGAIEQRLEAQGYVLIAPLQRRPSVYVADVSAGPEGYQRLIIDAWSGDILQRFITPARRWGPELATRGGEFAAPPPPGFVEPGPSGGFPPMSNASPAAKSAYGGPANVRIPPAISPVGSPEAPSATKPKPKSTATVHQGPETKPGTTTAPPAQPARPPDAGANAARNNAGGAAPAAGIPAPPDAVKPDGSTPAPPKPTENQDSDKAKTYSAPTEVENVPPASLEGPKDDASTASRAATPDLIPQAPKTEPQREAERPPSATAQSTGPSPRPAEKAATPESSSEPTEKSKVSIVPATLFE